MSLTPIPFRMLWHLAVQRGEALSKPYLYRTVLEREYSRYDRSLDMHIRRLLGDAGLAADPAQACSKITYTLRHGSSTSQVPTKPAGITKRSPTRTVLALPSPSRSTETPWRISQYSCSV